MLERIRTQKDNLAFLIKKLDSLEFPHIEDDFFTNNDSLLLSEKLGSGKLISEIYKEIISIRILIDNKHGIKSNVITLENAQKIWVRYTNDVELNQHTFNAKSITVFNYLRIFYVYLIAAIVISRIYKFDS
ncbi:MAG: hypothetical protein KIT56_02800, partial [Gammaproteobacteria bacterium]|nr:hypothetical protein [Gammaproteobacteria bacterium]